MKSLNQFMEEAHENKIEIFKNIFSAHLKELRDERQLSQNAVAEKLGCAVSTYANWEQGRREPCIYDIFNLMCVYDIDANELFNINNI